MIAHTSAPWRLSDDRDGKTRIQAGEWPRVQTLAIIVEPHRAPEQRAYNAALMVASPKLYAALEAIVVALDSEERLPVAELQRLRAQATDAINAADDVPEQDRIET